MTASSATLSQLYAAMTIRSVTTHKDLPPTQIFTDHLLMKILVVAQSIELSQLIYISERLFVLKVCRNAISLQIYLCI